MKKLEVTIVNVDMLIPYENNPRIHSKNHIDRVAKSIKEFGFTNPILVDDDLNVIAGHGRLEAAKSLKLSKVPVIKLVGLTPAQLRAYVIADNQLALDSNWDDEILQSELMALKLEDFDLSLLGWGDKPPTFEEDFDLSALEDSGAESELEDLSDKLFYSVPIKFSAKDHPDALELITKYDRETTYIGEAVLKALRGFNSGNR